MNILRKFSCFLFFVSLSFCLLLNTNKASAEFLFNPMTLYLRAPNGSGSTSITISNPTAEPIRLQLSVSEWEMSENGLTLDLPEEKQVVSKYIKISPMQFTLQGGQKRIVRLACALPPEIEDKEYKLFFSMLEISADRKEMTVSERYSMGLNVNKEMRIGTYLLKGPDSILKSDLKVSNIKAKKFTKDSALIFEYNLEYKNLGTMHTRKSVGARFFDSQDNIVWETKALGSLIAFPTEENKILKHTASVRMPDEETFKKASKVQLVFIDEEKIEPGKDILEKLSSPVLEITQE